MTIPGTQAVQGPTGRSSTVDSALQCSKEIRTSSLLFRPFHQDLPLCQHIRENFSYAVVLLEDEESLDAPVSLKKTASMLLRISGKLYAPCFRYMALPSLV